MKKCLKCGASVDDEANYCAVCGNQCSSDKRNAEEREPLDKKSGDSLFLKYAEFIDDAALYRAAVCKADGVGVEKNHEEAFELFRILAFRGNCDAMNRLADYFLALEPSDTQSALTWLKIAADAGHEQSRIRLKVLGLGVETRRPVEIPENAGFVESLVRSALPNIVMVRSSHRKGRHSIVSTGAGFIVDGGYVITNAHVAGNNPYWITAEFEQSVDEKTYNLIPLCVRPDLDIAVLKFSGFVAKKFAEQENLKFRLENLTYGEDVYTVGNPLGMGLSVSKGVISCPNRESDYPSGVSEVIQTDITANHGNSGGALLDSNNNVLGMLTFVPGNSEGGITMCVPSKYIVQVLNNL